ncbi:MAG: Coenzyme F420 hydrogenase/dehydrogenase, beta subunit C-terminal domain [Candidatus Bathyarchaeota archaeon]|nr:Coenzyme F420 hydrogenase/dehydrogenase, beta subunit C-terminal domain [Candidatus Bathyarchaeota archaeon]
MTDKSQIEQLFLSGSRDENLGVYSELFSAKSGVEGQAGGVVTALLLSGLKKSVFDAAIVVCRKRDRYLAEVVVAENAEAVWAARGALFLKVNVLYKLKELVVAGKKRIALVCLPCQVQAARKLQQALRRSNPDVEITLIGLFCFEAFTPEKLKTEVQKLTGEDIDRAEKVHIRKGQLVIQIKGKTYTCKVAALNNAVLEACRRCDDFTAALADVSVGSVGSPTGYSTVIVRSEVGQRMLQGLRFEKAETEKTELIKLCQLKRARKNFQK